MLQGIFRTKNLDEILAGVGGPQFELRRTLTAFSVTLIGIVAFHDSANPLRLFCIVAIMGGIIGLKMLES